MAMKSVFLASIATVIGSFVLVAPAMAQDAAAVPKKPVAAAQKAATTAAKAVAKPAAKAAVKTAAAKPAAAKPAAAKPAVAKAAVAKPAAAKVAAAKPAKPAVAGKPGTYVPAAVVLGAAVKPPAGLEGAAKQLRAAAAAKDAEAVAALVADEVTVVMGGLDLARGRTAQKVDAQGSAETIVRFLGDNAGGDGDIPKDLSGRERDRILFDRAFGLIVASIDDADWGRDPLVTGATCTHRGTQWKGEAVKGQGVGAVSGGIVEKPTPVRASADLKAKPVDTLQPGRLYLTADGAAAPAGWTAVRLPKGGSGFVRVEALSTPNRAGICFLPTAEGGWLMSAISGVGL